MTAPRQPKRSAIRRTSETTEPPASPSNPDTPIPTIKMPDPLPAQPVETPSVLDAPPPAPALPKMETRARDEGIAQLKGLDKKEVYNLVTSMFLDCGDENLIAEALDERYGVAFDTNTVRRIRFEAAKEADGMDDAQARKAWIFRYSFVTMNNLIKEYMFIMRSQNFYEAKVELADEFFWLQQKFSRKQLWMALNEAVGRNNVPIDIVDELIEFRETMMHIKQVIAGSAKQKKADPTMLLIEVSEKMDEAYRGECAEDSIKTAEFACKFLDIEQGSLKPADIEFLREYFKCSKFPDRNDGDSIMKLVEGADTLEKRSPLKEAAAGNAPNLSSGELFQLTQEMRSSPLLKAEQLERIGSFASRRSKSGDPDGILAKLKDAVEDHLLLLDIGKFCTSGELLKLKVQGASSDELQEILKMLNSLSNAHEVQSYSAKTLEISSHPKIVETFISKYRKKRFGGG